MKGFEKFHTQLTSRHPEILEEFKAGKLNNESLEVVETLSKELVEKLK